jgi:hypothetical protein
MAALFVEQYLKCLLQLEARQFPESHDLQLLFNQLNPRTRAQIRKIHDTRLSSLSNEVVDGLAAEFEKRHGKKASLDAFLQHGKDAFEAFRYPFHKNVDVDAITFVLNLFGDVVRNYIVNLHPEWEEDVSIFPDH